MRKVRFNHFIVKKSRILSYSFTTQSYNIKEVEFHGRMISNFLSTTLDRGAHTGKQGGISLIATSYRRRSPHHG